MEREQKYRIKNESDFLYLKNYVSNICKFLNRYTQTDLYLSHPCKKFEMADEAFRIRYQIDLENKSDIELTYKGPREKGPLKIRKEISLKLCDSDNLDQVLNIFSELGFQVAYTIYKIREDYDCDWSKVSLDVVTDLGMFLEIEIKKVDELNKIDEFLKNIISKGLFIEVERKTYLELLLEKLSK